VWFLYIVQCKDGSFYTGITTSIKRRFLEHKTGRGGLYTRKKKANQVVHLEKFQTKKEALEREKQIKGWRREKKVNLIKGKLRSKNQPV